MSKRKSTKAVNSTPTKTTDITSNIDKITPQYRHIKELSILKYDAEEKREQNLIQQSSQMQTVFSFMTAAIFMAVPICIENRGALSLEFFLVSVSCIVTFLIVSLFLASLAQWRWKTEALPDIKQLKAEILDNSEWEKMTIEYNQIDQLVNLIGKVQERKAILNDRRVNLIIASMSFFYCSIAIIIITFFIGIAMIF